MSETVARHPVVQHISERNESLIRSVLSDKGGKPLFWDSEKVFLGRLSGDGINRTLRLGLPKAEFKPLIAVLNEHKIKWGSYELPDRWVVTIEPKSHLGHEQLCKDFELYNAAFLEKHVTKPSSPPKT